MQYRHPPLRKYFQLARASVFKVAPGGAHRAPYRQCQFGGGVIFLVAGVSALQAMGEPVAFLGIHKHITTALRAALQFPVSHISPLIKFAQLFDALIRESKFYSHCVHHWPVDWLQERPVLPAVAG